MARMNLRDDQWERIEHLLPGKADKRLFVEAVLWMARSGAPWRDLPEELGPWNSVYKRFAPWERRGAPTDLSMPQTSHKISQGEATSILTVGGF
jgi:transposase